MDHYFDRLHRRLRDEGHQAHDSRQVVLEAYLDGKPQAAVHVKPTRADRDRWFWSSAFVGECGHGDWASEAGILALTRYLSQDKVGIDGLVESAALSAPQALAVAMRRARLIWIA